MMLCFKITAVWTLLERPQQPWDQPTLSVKSHTFYQLLKKHPLNIKGVLMINRWSQQNQISLLQSCLVGLSKPLGEKISKIGQKKTEPLKKLKWPFWPFCGSHRELEPKLFVSKLTKRQRFRAHKMGQQSGTLFGVFFLYYEPVCAGNALIKLGNIGDT